MLGPSRPTPGSSTPDVPGRPPHQTGPASVAVRPAEPGSLRSRGGRISRSSPGSPVPAAAGPQPQRPYCPSSRAGPGSSATRPAPGDPDPATPRRSRWPARTAVSPPRAPSGPAGRTPGCSGSPPRRCGKDRGPLPGSPAPCETPPGPRRTGPRPGGRRPTHSGRSPRRATRGRRPAPGPAAPLQQPPGLIHLALTDQEPGEVPAGAGARAYSPPGSFSQKAAARRASRSASAYRPSLHSSHARLFRLSATRGWSAPRASSRIASPPQGRLGVGVLRLLAVSDRQAGEVDGQSRIIALETPGRCLDGRPHVDFGLGGPAFGHRPSSLRRSPPGGDPEGPAPRPG